MQAPKLLLRAAALVAFGLLACQAQQYMPFAGGGQDEPSKPTDVYVSTYIDRLMFIDDKQYEFQAMVFVYLSWTDPRAKEVEAKNRKKLSAPDAADKNITCKMQCQLYPQNQPVPVAGCCDDVWLPYVSFPTLKLLSQDRVMRWGVNIDTGTDGVAYWSIFMGTFMASFDLRAFPFDTQRLHVQMEVPGWAGGNIILKPSSAGTRMFNTNPDGDALSGWRVERVRMAKYELPLCQRYTPSSSQASDAADPAPLVSAFLYNSPQMQKKPGVCATMLARNRQDPSFLVYTRQNLDPEERYRENEPLNVTGVTCTIVIKRFYTQWIMTAILPLIASTWFGFVVFLLPRDSLEARLGAVLTIFVAQAAIQFVVSQEIPNSSYMTALQQMVAAGYVVLILIGVESVFIWWVTTYQQHHQRYRRHRAARRQFESDLQVQMHELEARLAELLSRQSNTSRSLSRSLSALRSPYSAVRASLSAAKAHKGAGAVGGSGKSVSSLNSDPPEGSREAAAAAAVAAADIVMASDQQAAAAAPQQQPLDRRVSFSGAPPTVHNHGAGAGSKGGGKGGGKDAGAAPPPSDAAASSRQLAADRAKVEKLREAQEVHKQMRHLQQQLDDLKALDREQQQLAAAGGGGGHATKTGTMLFGLSKQQQQPAAGPASHDYMRSDSANAPDMLRRHALCPADGDDAAAADADSVALTMHSGASSKGDDGCPSGSRTPTRSPTWRWCTSSVLYLTALQRDENLADQLAYLVNKWLAVIQFALYNLSIILVFAINTLLFRKD